MAESEKTGRRASMNVDTKLVRELAEAERWLAGARERLAHVRFMSRAPADVGAGAQAREAELAEQVGRLRDRLGR